MWFAIVNTYDMKHFSYTSSCDDHPVHLVLWDDDQPLVLWPPGASWKTLSDLDFI